MSEAQQPSQRAAKRPARSPPLVADPELMAKLRIAAAAIFCDVETLCDMVVDGGLKPPRERATQSYTLEDLGKRLWSELQMYARPKRVEWYQKLSEIQQRALIVVLRDHGHSSMAIADEFQIKLERVNKIWNAFCDDLGSQVVGMRLDTIVGQLTLNAERAKHWAAEMKDYSSFWRISSSYVEALQSLGVVDRAIQRVDHRHSVSTDNMREIEELVQLERKKERRFEEIKLADAAVLSSDKLPQLTVDYDDDESEQEKL